jgi:hypothetical protein
MKRKKKNKFGKGKKKEMKVKEKQRYATRRQELWISSLELSSRSLRDSKVWSAGHIWPIPLSNRSVHMYSDCNRMYYITHNVKIILRERSFFGG